MGPNLDYLLQSIRPAVARTSGQPADTRLRAAILANVEETINQLLDTSAVLKHMAEAQQLTLVGAYYELATGRVHFSEPVGVIPKAKSASKATPTSQSARAGCCCARASGGDRRATAPKPPPSCHSRSEADAIRDARACTGVEASGSLR